MLSLVIEHPAAGADVCRRFEARFDGLLESRRNHIYDALGRLVRDGLIERMAPGGRDGAALGRGSSFRAAAAGARAHRAWIREPVPCSKEARHETLVRFASTHEHDVESALRLLDGYEEVVLVLAERPVSFATTLIDSLVAEERQDLAQAELRWIRRSRARLRDATRDRGQESR